MDSKMESPSALKHAHTVLTNQGCSYEKKPLGGQAALAVEPYPADALLVTILAATHASGALARAHMHTYTCTCSFTCAHTQLTRIRGLLTQSL